MRVAFVLVVLVQTIPEASAAPIHPMDPICRGAHVEITEDAPFRGVRPIDNGSGWCCPLDAASFLCVMHDGMQHAPYFHETARFFRSASTPAALEFQVRVWKNMGMTAHDHPLVVELVATRTPKGFEAWPAPPSACAKPYDWWNQDLCTHGVGRWHFQDGIPTR